MHDFGKLIQMQLTSAQEHSYFNGNALRNLGKLARSGIIEKITRHSKKHYSNEKPLELKIQRGNPEDAYTLLESIIAQQQRKEIQKKNRLPKGHTRSPKLGVENYAFHKGYDPTDAANYISRRRGVIIISLPGIELINDFIKENEGFV